MFQKEIILHAFTILMYKVNTWHFKILKKYGIYKLFKTEENLQKRHAKQLEL